MYIYILRYGHVCVCVYMLPFVAVKICGKKYALMWCHVANAC